LIFLGFSGIRFLRYGRTVLVAPRNWVPAVLLSSTLFPRLHGFDRALEEAGDGSRRKTLGNIYPLGIPRDHIGPV